LGRQIKRRETRLGELQGQNKKLRDQLQMLRSPKPLEKRVRDLNLGLGQVQPDQIRRLTEPLPPVRGETDRQFAGQPTRDSRLARSP